MARAGFFVMLALAATGCNRPAMEALRIAPDSSPTPLPSPTPFLPAGFVGLTGEDAPPPAPREPGGGDVSPQIGPRSATAQTRSLDLAAVLATINRIREREGLSPLKVSPGLSELAQVHADELSDSRSLWHVEAGSGRDPGQRMIQAGYSGPLAEHAIAVPIEEGDPVGVVLQALLTDRAHRGNLLAPQFSLTGLGLSDDGEWWYLVQLLAQAGPSE